tara:strand:- start:645 stop:1118 length:474 start_codon:yes stop_codon:yes gene_type:complete
MSEISVKTPTRNYSLLQQEINALIEGESNVFANIGNILAAIKFRMNWFWVGLYKVENDELVLFMFQGPHACTRIKKGSGVCGTAWLENRTLIVDDVNLFDGHIACNSASKSEIVLPIKDKNGAVVYILDIDSEHLNAFNDNDENELKKVVTILENLI